MPRNSKTEARIKRVRKDRLLYWYANLLRLVEGARKAQIRARSYRDFNVGSNALCLLSNGHLAVLSGANRKDAAGPRGPHDHCAEMQIIDDARSRGVSEIFGFATFAPHQPDDVSGVDLGVTTLCIYCRRRFTAELNDPKGPIKPHTIMYFVNADEPTKQVGMPIEKLLQLLK